VSGAGRSLKENLLHAELSEGTQPYAGGARTGIWASSTRSSRRSPGAGRDPVHAAPDARQRGILATVYVRGDAGEVHATLAAAYTDESLPHVLPFGAVPSTRDVRGSNFVHIGRRGRPAPGRAIVVAALDNLTKGSSGQAVQNANLMLGEEETAGLMLAPLFP
jgi:N-acetyl-gamma-glutamyl-phosphate reductase